MSAQRLFWTLVLSSAAILAVTMGIRQSTGLFVSPLNTATGLGIVLAAAGALVNLPIREGHPRAATAAA